VAFHPFRHLGLKIAAVVLATLLWLSVAGEHVVERSLRVPLDFRNLPSELEIVGDAPSSVDVRLRGSSGILSRLAPGEVVAGLDLATARPGSRLFPIRNDEVRVPFGVEVAQVVPGTVSVEIEKSARRVVPVVPAIDGEPAPGFVVGKIVPNPATVEVIGPESRLRQLTGATTEPVSVAGRTERVSDVVTIGVVDSAVRLVRVQSATVVVEVNPAPVEHELSGVPVRGRNLGSGLQAIMEPNLIRVTARGRREALADLRADAVNAFVNLEGLGPGHYNLRIQVDPTQNFGVSAITPAVVDVTIR
jgi:YbbR domain-containing protein